MDKDEILRRSKSENEYGDEMEAAAEKAAGNCAFAVGGIICVLLIILETVLKKAVNTSAWAVFIGMYGTSLIVKYRHLHKRMYLFIGLFQLAVSVAFIIIYIIKLLR